MSTHLPGFHSFSRIFASFYIGQISHQQHKDETLNIFYSFDAKFSDDVSFLTTAYNIIFLIIACCLSNKAVIFHQNSERMILYTVFIYMEHYHKR